MNNSHEIILFQKNRGWGAPEALLEVPSFRRDGNASMTCSRQKITCSQPPASILTTRASGIAAGTATVGHMLRQSVQPTRAKTPP